MRYLGILDIIRIRREGFPIHLTFSEFITKYKCLIRNKTYSNSRNDILLVLRELQVPETEWQIGKTKIFLRSSANDPLENERKSIRCANSIIIQKNWRRHWNNKYYKNVKKSILIIQHAYRGWKLRIKFLRIRRSVIIIQSRLRGVFAREVSNIFEGFTKCINIEYIRKRVTIEYIN